MNPEREEGLYYPDGTYKSRNEIIKSKYIVIINNPPLNEYTFCKLK